MERFAFTVFTPTFNREATLPRVYESLKAQTFRDFEWSIVDDGSSDGTRELVDSWRREATFPIGYTYQANAGKHVAFNRAVARANGALFLPLDSDDSCVPETLERFWYWWESIPIHERSSFSGVTVSCRDQHGSLVGTPFPAHPLDSDAIDVRLRHRVRGEKWGFHRTDVLREFPFPEPEGVRFVAEDVVWRTIALRFKTRFVNETLRTYWIDERGPGAPALSALSSNVLHGRVLYHLQTLNDLMPRFWTDPRSFLASAVNLVRYRSLEGMGPTRLIEGVTNRYGRLLAIAAVPIGLFVAHRDRRRGQVKR